MSTTATQPMATAKTVDWSSPPEGTVVRTIAVTVEQALAYYDAVAALETATVHETGEAEQKSVAVRALLQEFQERVAALGAITGSPFRVRYAALELDYLAPAPVSGEGG